MYENRISAMAVLSELLLNGRELALMRADLVPLLLHVLQRGVKSGGGGGGGGANTTPHVASSSSSSEHVEVALARACGLASAVVRRADIAASANSVEQLEQLTNVVW